MLSQQVSVEPKRATVRTWQPGAFVGSCRALSKQIRYVFGKQNFLTLCYWNRSWQGVPIFSKGLRVVLLLGAVCRLVGLIGLWTWPRRSVSSDEPLCTCASLVHALHYISCARIATEFYTIGVGFQTVRCQTFLLHSLQYYSDFVKSSTSYHTVSRI